MKKALPILIGLAIVVVLSFTWVMDTYNKMVSTREDVTSKWAQVENQYQRRFDLIPNLVESVKGSMKQEQAVFGAIAEARTRYSGASTVNEKAQAASQMESALGRLLVVMENYPELKSNENVQMLMVQLEGTENRISVERQRYNDTVQTYNTRLKTFPANLFATVFNFTPAEYFKTTEEAKTAPKVQF